MANKCGCEVVHVLCFQDPGSQVQKWVIVRATTTPKWLWRRSSEVMKESDTVLLMSYLYILVKKNLDLCRIKGG